jgi:tetratricopeptide (TPR) repeat protein
MQLRVPKQYRRSARGRRRGQRRLLPSRRVLITWFILIGLTYGGYWIVRNPDEARVNADNFQKNVQTSIEQNRQEFFPSEPTPTPDVQDDLIEGDRAYRVGDLEQAIQAYKIAIKGNPNDVLLHYRLAHTLVITSNFGRDSIRIQEALEVSELAINAAPESPLGWSVRAMALDWSGEYELALASIQRALELDPNSLIAKAHLINIYRNTGNPDLALTTAKAAIEEANARNASSDVIAQIYRNYARLLLVGYQDRENAIEAYEFAYQSMPNQTYIAIELANSYDTVGESSKAITLLEEVNETNPRDLQILSTLGRLYTNTGDNRYMNVYTRCVSINPTYAPCASPLGQLYFWSKDYANAISNLKNAVDNGSTDPYDYYLLARSYWNLNQCAEAAPYFNRGYQIIVENGDTDQVSISNFVDAMNICGLPIPQIQPTATPTAEAVETTPSE